MTEKRRLASYRPRAEPMPPANATSRKYGGNALIDMLNMGNAPRGVDLSEFAINRNRMLEEEARQEQLYKIDNMQPVELPERAPAEQASLNQILMNQYDPATAPAASFMLRSLSAASQRGRDPRVDKRAEDAAFAIERDRINNFEMPAEIGSPGYKGRAFDAFQYLIGRKRAL